MLSNVNAAGAAIGFLALGLVACGSTNSPAGGGGGASGSGGAISADQACADVASARCTQRSMCSMHARATGPGANLVRTYGDMQTCVARETLACKNGLAAPQTGNSPNEVEKCVAAFPTYSCQSYFDNDPPTDCAVTGARANGATCTFNGQCSSGFCQGTKNSVCGTCADPPQPGADCSVSACWHNQNCLASSMTCAAVVSMNGACNAAMPCDNALSCVGSSSTATGTCQPAGATVGAACGGTMPGCDGTLGLYCVSSTRMCAALAFVGDGQPCGLLADGTRAACIAGECYTATGTAGSSDVGTCKASVDAASACDTVLGPSCLAPAKCVLTGGGSAGTCVVPTADMCPS
jgi:hypothetical protein